MHGMAIFLFNKCMHFIGLADHLILDHCFLAHCRHCDGDDDWISSYVLYSMHCDGIHRHQNHSQMMTRQIYEVYYICNNLERNRNIFFSINMILNSSGINNKVDLSFEWEYCLEKDCWCGLKYQLLVRKPSFTLFFLWKWFPHRLTKCQTWQSFTRLFLPRWSIYFINHVNFIYAITISRMCSWIGTLSFLKYGIYLALKRL